ncbi:MAG TPA: hypothetical protein VKF62_14285 [Planctomycetota bacterium]|nr:hypothetical protein [Planctomycetota bacterium]
MGLETRDGFEGLFDRIGKGDGSARSELLRRLRFLLEAAMRANLSPRLRAWVGLEEALQEAWIRVDRELDGLEYRGPEALRSWLTKVARTTLASLARREQANRRDRRRDRRLPTRPSAVAGSLDARRSKVTTPSAALSRQEDRDGSREIVEAAMKALGEPDATIVRMWNLTEPRPSWKEVGDAIGRKPDAARKAHDGAWERFLDEVIRERLRRR